MSLTQVDVKYISAAPVMNNISPFLVDQPVNIDSVAGTTLYGANHPGRGSTTKYQKFVQSIASNKAFALATAMSTPLSTISGAIAAADQLRTVVVVSTDPSSDLGKTPLLGARADQVAPTGGFTVGAGGGTAAADATLIIKGTTAADLLLGSATLSLASTGANTKTLLVGDKVNIAGDATDYYVTGTTYTLNGTTEIEVAITPPLQKAAVASTVVTVTAGNGKVILTGATVSIPVGATVEVFVFAAADIITITGGAMTAGRKYVVGCMTFYHSAGNVNLSRLRG
jgi:hypothetical protein